MCIDFCVFGFYFLILTFTVYLMDSGNSIPPSHKYLGCVVARIWRYISQVMSQIQYIASVEFAEDMCLILGFYAELEESNG